MPVTVKTAVMKYKNGQGNYVEVNAVSDNATAEQIAAINTAGTNQTSAVNGAGAIQVAAVQAKGAETLASIPSDYTNLSNDVDDLKSAFTIFKGNNPYTVKDNYYVNSTGSESSSSLYELYTVEVVEGKKVFGSTGCASNSTGYLCFYNANGQIVGEPFRNDVADVMEYDFNLTVPAGATTLKITNRKAWNIPVTFATGDASGLLVEYDRKITNLENVASGLFTSSSIDFSTGTSGFINYSGALTSHNDYYHVDIEVNVGDTIAVNTYSVPDAIAVFAKKIGSTYTPLLIADANQRKTYSYTATEKMTLTISYLNATKSGTVTFNVSANNVELVIADYQKRITQSALIPNYAEMFHTVGVIGDSLASGEIAYTDNGNNVYVDKYDYSWLSNLCRNCGTTPKHYSKGGMMANTWLDDNGGCRTAFENDTACNAYFIALGTNDMASSIPLGTASDVAGTATFVGYIKQIISLVHTKAPNAVVFLMSTYADHSISRTWSDMIETVSGLYDYCYYVDFLNNTDIYTTSNAPYTSLGHFTTPAYVDVGKTIQNLVNAIVNDNYSDFMLFAVNN